ncbi:hypothetical protein Tco_1030279 [Tanacetum coccineum]|uniref:Retrovirus-related Pol polyprotein from transposon TNT 1-94 n=1 Tax=Tanacetum coccineum TaxID=301880 RepID=A0ABQ5G5S4_9ASTR
MVPPNNLGPDLASKPVNETLYIGMIGSLILGFDFKGYSNTDYVGCNMDRKSTSGACQILGGKLVCWSAKKQQSVAMSSTEAKYVVTDGCCANILWMKSQLSDYDIYYKMFFDDLLNENTLPPDVSNVENDFQDNKEEIDISCDMIPRELITDDDSEETFLLLWNT